MSQEGFLTDVWSVQLDNGETNDLLIASSDGTQNVQRVKFNFPHPAGEALFLTITSSNPTQNVLWDTDTPIAGTDTPIIAQGTVATYNFNADPGTTSATFWDGATAGSITVGVLSFKLSGISDTEDSTTDYLAAMEAGAGTVPTTDPTSNVASQVSLNIKGSFGGSTGSVVTGSTQNVMVGDEVDVAAAVVGPASIVSRLKYQWTVPGNVLYDWGPKAGTVSYADVFAAGAVTTTSDPQVQSATTSFGETHVDATGLKSGSEQVAAEFFWVTTANGTAPDLDVVEVSASSMDDDTFALYAATTCKVYEPTVTANSVPQAATTSSGGKIADPATTFTIKLTDPGWLTGAASRTSLLQLANVTMIALAPGTIAMFYGQTQWLVDGGFLPFAPSSFLRFGSLDKIWPVNTLPTPLPYDTPTWDATKIPGCTLLTINDSFHTYAMYSDGKPGTHWVPVGIAKWGYGGTTFLQSRFILPAYWATSGSLYPAVPLTGAFASYVGTEPEWKSLIPFPIVGSGFI
jgi:hypothetical protein